MFWTYRQRLNSGEIVRTNMKRLCGFAALLRRIAPSSVVCRSVCLSLCQSVTLMSPAKTAETIKLPFAFRTRVGPMNHVLHEVQTPTWEGAILTWGGNRQTVVKYRDTLQSSVIYNDDWTDRGAIGVVDSHGPKASCVTWEVQIPHGKGQFWWIGAPIVKYRHFLP